MTADDIRSMEIRTDASDPETLRNGVRMLREIAAQLAELNFAASVIAQHLDRLAETQEEAHK